MITWIVICVVVIAFVVMLYARQQVLKGEATLNYELHPTSGNAWERRCEASLRASRRRRGLD